VSGNRFDGELKSDQCQHHINNVQCQKRCQIGLSVCWIHLLSECHLRIKESTIIDAGIGLFALIKKTHLTKMYKFFLEKEIQFVCTMERY
jgi:hypothetical protein